MYYIPFRRHRISEHGVRFRFFGNLSLLSVELQSLIAKIELLTEKYDTLDFARISRFSETHSVDFSAHINVCLAYTSHDEMTRAIRTVVTGVKEGHIHGEYV